MLRFTNTPLIKFFFSSFLFLFFLYGGKLESNKIRADYDIEWNKINLGNIVWNISINNQDEYEFFLKIKNSDFFSSLYPFYGEYYSTGNVIKSAFIPTKYYHKWKTKKKNNFVQITFNNNEINNFNIIPKPNNAPYLNFYQLQDTRDPLSAALELIINDDKRIIKNVFDGRRTYELSTNEKFKKKININNNILSGNYHNLEINNYKNVWKDHNNKDLKKVEIVTSEIVEGLILPINFKIINKGLIIRIRYKNHQIIN